MNSIKNSIYFSYKENIHTNTFSKNIFNISLLFIFFKLEFKMLSIIIIV